MEHSVNLSLEIVDQKLIKDIFSDNYPNEGDKYQPNEFLDIEVIKNLSFRSHENIITVLEVLITFSSSVAINIVSSWIYDKLKNGKAKLRINENNVDVYEAIIRKELEKNINK